MKKNPVSEKEEETFMRLALAEAEKALACGDVPVGAVLVREGKILACGHNTRVAGRKPTGHAEINVLEEAAGVLGSWRLDRCTLYVTLEPCMMCAGAISQAHVERIVYGARDAVAGACGSVFSLNRYPLGPKVRIEGGILAAECQDLLRRFFDTMRRSPAGESASEDIL